MYFSDRLIFKGVENEKEIFSYIKKGYDVFNIFILCKGRGKNIFELFELSELRTEFMKYKPYKVLGIAGGKQNGMLMAAEIIEDYYKHHNSLIGLKESL